jgi:Fe-S cluster biogenesis protein NfuA
MAADRVDVGARVEALLVQVDEQGGTRAAAAADELVRLLVDYYGTALARIAELIGADAVRGLAADPHVASLLILHGLHPVGVTERVEQALDRLRPQLGSGAITFVGVDDEDVAHLRLASSGSGCASSTRAVIEDAVLAAAPELQRVEIEQATDRKPVLQIGMRPGAVASEAMR